jgi:alanine racemase
MRNAAVIIHIDNFLYNLGRVRELAGPSVKICAPVKANAYGHGAVQIAAAAEKAGADFLGVAAPAEAAELRAAGIRLPILLFGLCLPQDAEGLLRNDVSAVAVDDAGIAFFEEAAAKTNKKARLHLKIDTGMGRIGCTPEDAPRLARRIASSPRLILEGVCTHFAVSDTRERAFTLRQIEIFRSALERIWRDGVSPVIVHAANSGALLQYPEAHFDMARPGILLYGYYPSGETPRPFPLKPVMELRAPVLWVKQAAAGTPISYGCTYTAPAPTWIATLGIGYADGYPRLASGKGRALIGGTFYPIAGRVTMDQTMLNLGPQTEIKPGDQAVLFGPGGAPGADEVAAHAQTIAYEITCGINPRAPRRFV